MQFILVLLISVIPIFSLCAYIYHEDRYEKESIPFLTLLFGVGILCATCSVFVENTGILFLNKVFSRHMIISFNEITFATQISEYTYNFIYSFLFCSAIDIILAIAALFIFTYKNKNFNSLFDGIVYAVYIMMGVSLAEILFFGYNKGWDLVALKCLLTIPLRMFTGVIIGYLYSILKIKHLIYTKEKILNSTGKLNIIPIFKKYRTTIIMFFFPWLLNGIYEFSTLMNTYLWRYLYYIVLIGMYFYCIKKITHASNNDDLFTNIVRNAVLDKHTTLTVEDYEQ